MSDAASGSLLSAPQPAIEVSGLSHAYGQRAALTDLSFRVQPGEIFGLLGPNGGGKTTLFRILSTLLPVQSGSVAVLGHDAGTDAEAIRRKIGVTFQSPSLDKKLTVSENLRHQGHLYGLSGTELTRQIDDQLKRLGLTDRRNDRAESLSGGLARRVEIAKGLLHQPQLLLLDEPSTGLDPGARIDLWKYLHQLRDTGAVTVLVTTHLMEEAERCDRLGILDQGKLVALGTPAELRAAIGGDCVTIQTPDPDGLAQRIRDRFSLTPQRVGESLRVEAVRGHEFLRDLVDAFRDEITSISLAKPTLEDVFVLKTGHRFWDVREPEAASGTNSRRKKA